MNWNQFVACDLAEKAMQRSCAADAADDFHWCDALIHIGTCVLTTGAPLDLRSDCTEQDSSFARNTFRCSEEELNEDGEKSASREYSGMGLHSGGADDMPDEVLAMRRTTYGRLKPAVDACLTGSAGACAAVLEDDTARWVSGRFGGDENPGGRELQLVYRKLEQVLAHEAKLCLHDDLPACEHAVRLTELTPDYLSGAPAPYRPTLGAAARQDLASALDVQCEHGYWRACAREISLAAPPKRSRFVPPSLAYGAAEVQRDCRADEVRSCAQLGWLSRSPAARERVKALTLASTEGPCGKGDGEACEAAGAAMELVKADATRAQRFYAKACDLGRSTACEALVDADGAAHDAGRARALLRVCEAGDMRACVRLDPSASFLPRSAEAAKVLEMVPKLCAPHGNTTCVWVGEKVPPPLCTSFCAEAVRSGRASAG